MLFKKGNIPWNKGIPRTEECKRKISVANKVKNRSEETQKKMSESAKERIKKYGNSFEGKHHSEEIKRKWSKDRKGSIPWNKGKKTGHIPWNKIYFEETKQCEYCEKIIKRNPNDTWGMYAKRRFCSHPCYIKKIKESIENRKFLTCLMCGKTDVKENFYREKKWCLICAKNYAKEHHKKYYQEHKELIKERIKKWREENKERLNKRRKKFYIQNREEIQRKKKENRIRNLEKARYLHRIVCKKYLNTYKGNLNHKMRVSISRSLKGNKNGRHWETLVGYTCEDLIKRLRRTMPLRCTWKDFLSGNLHIDHIIPISVFNFEKPEDIDFKRCWALKNLRLLSAKENLSKNAKIDKSFQPSLLLAVDL